VITSAKNPKIKEIRALQGRARARREAGLFVVEGVRLAEEALAGGWQPELALFTADLNQRGQALVSQMQSAGIPLEEVSPEVMKSASDTQNAQGILLVLPVKSQTLPADLDFALILDQVRDPGNLGTLLRSAAAAGVQVVFLPPEGVDPLSPKVLRSAMGAHFRLPILSLEYPEIESHCREHGLAVLVAAAQQGQSHTDADLTRPVALVIGGETDGPSQEVQKFAAGYIHIPMPGESESLNAAMAGTILLFEIVRQRGNQ